MTNDNRVPGGVPQGGQFAPGERDESDDLEVDTHAGEMDAILQAHQFPEDATRAMVEHLGITMEAGTMAVTQNPDDGSSVVSVPVYLENPRTGRTMQCDYSFYTRQPAKQPTTDEVVVSLSAEAWSVETASRLVEKYARDAGEPYDTDEEKSAVAAKFAKAEEIRDGLGELLGDDLDAFMFGSTTRPDAYRDDLR